jgi:hypothetical protein
LSRGPGAGRVAAAVAGGAAILAAADGLTTAFTIPPPAKAAGGIGLALSAHAFDAAETFGVGVVAALAAAAFVRVTRWPPRALFAALVAASAAVTHRVLGEYLSVFSEHALDGRLATAIYLVWFVAISVGVAAAPVVASAAATRTAPRAALVAVAVGALVVNEVMLRDDYFDVHGIFAVGAALFGGGAISEWVLGGWVALSVGRRRALVVALGGIAAFGAVCPPSNAVRCQLFRAPAAVAPWVLATLAWRSPEPHGAATRSPWLDDRTAVPAIPPTSPGVLPANAVVVLLTLDALRAEAAFDPRNDTAFPTLAALRRDGVVFTHASSAGAQTETSFATVFSSRYFSELKWSDTGSGWSFHPHPVEDRFPRFPELLGARGVTTANFAGIAFLGEGFGVTRGFQEETRVLFQRTSAPAFRLIGPLLERLRHAGDGPLFLSVHLIDTHAPYGRAREGQSDYERYLGTIGATDRQVGLVLHALETNFGDRWALFVSADHGEAFGEHGTTDHGKTLYEELLHVPLLARGPRFPAHVVDARVGLVDLAPTFLDLFGVATPASFEGQSLVPFLAGGRAPLTRPIIAEGRLRRALTTPDGLKVIDDPRRKLVEVYDLAKDPLETTNLYDTPPGRGDAALAELRAFFAAHAWKESGYSPPYKP